MTAMFVMLGVISEVADAWAAGRGANSIAVLFALVLGLALGIGLTALSIALFLALQQRHRQPAVVARPVHWSRRRRWQPRTRSGPDQWLAIAHSHPHLVQAALKLHDSTPCSWAEGLHAAQEHRLFIAPPIGPWTLVLGAGLPDPAADADACFHFLRQMSAQLGEVQFFSVNRARQQHAWARAVAGEIHRAYAWADRTVWQQGAMTPAERDLGLVCYAYGEGPGRVRIGRPHPIATNTERVPLLAARWSVNPASIDLRSVTAAQGISGRWPSSQLR